MTTLIDTHCHLDLDSFEADRDDVIRRAVSAGVDQMIVIGFDPDRWESGKLLCERFDGLHLAIGLHPTEAELFDDEMESRIRRKAVEYRAVAIGETGIDYHWKADTSQQQKEAFARQVALAKELGLPFIIHQREAEQDTLDVLGASSPPHRGVMHCFTGDVCFMRECLDLGLHIGLGGAITFRKLKDLHAAARDVPIDRVLLETDAPFMTPSPHRGERNEPSYVRFVADRLAELKGVSIDEVADATTRNAAGLFGLGTAQLSAGRSARGDC